MKPMTAVAAFGLALGMMATGTARADSFGSGVNSFTIDFVNIGNAGNTNDVGGGGGISSSPYGGVAYDYQISTYEISQDAIDKATNLGLTNVTAGEYTGAQPAANISWYEAAAFVNWLNTSTGHQAAYDLTFSLGSWSMSLWGASDQATTGVDSGTNAYRHKDAYYFMPSEDEWYKAAYHQNDGVTANYYDYATGSNTAPTAVASGTAQNTAVFESQSAPAAVNLSGGLSAYGTMGQNGNVSEFFESAADGTNNSTTELRGERGATYINAPGALLSSERGDLFPGLKGGQLVGFRVAAVPEPSTALLMLMAGGAMLLGRRGNRSSVRS